MARILKGREPKKSIAVVVDGEDEKMYIYKAKEYTTSDLLKRSRVKPEIGQNKKCAALFQYAKDKLAEGYSQVVLILDFDTIRRDDAEFAVFETLYGQYISGKNTNQYSKKTAWMKDLVVLINNPCIEYWFLLHFKKTNKFFDCYDSLRPELIKNKPLKDYDKSKEYYTKSPDIFLRLGGQKGLASARINARDSIFELSSCRSKGVSEMGAFFDLFD